MTIRDYIRYACHDGGLVLYDNRMPGGLAGLNEVSRFDWEMFFEMLRDHPTPRTDELIDAVKDGLCPVYLDLEVNPGCPPSFEARRRPVWVFRKRNKNGCDGIIQMTPFDPNYVLVRLGHYTGGSLADFCLLTDPHKGRSWKKYRDLTGRFRRRPEEKIPVWGFSSMNDAWEFLFRCMTPQEVKRAKGPRA